MSPATVLASGEVREAELRRKLAAAEAREHALREALNQATDAIDAVESEPGREGGPMFRIDWVRALKLVRADPADGALRELLHRAVRLCGGRDDMIDEAVVDAVLRGDR